MKNDGLSVAPKRWHQRWKEHDERLEREHPVLAAIAWLALAFGVLSVPVWLSPESKDADVVRLVGGIAIGLTGAAIERLAGLVFGVPVWAWFVIVPLFAIWRHIDAAERRRWEAERERRHEWHMQNDPQYFGAVMDARHDREIAEKEAR